MRTIVLTFYVSSDATDDEREDLRAVGAEVVGDFTGNFLLEEVFHDISDRAKPLPTHGEWVYLQRGLRSR